jgi:hypothetical protein
VFRIVVTVPAQIEGPLSRAGLSCSDHLCVAAASIWLRRACPEVGFVEVKSLFTFYPREHDLPCEVTAYDWSCNQPTMVLAFLEKWLHLCPLSRVAELRTFCIMLRNGIAGVRWLLGVRVRVSLAHQESAQGPGLTSLIRAVFPFSVPTWGCADTEDGRALRRLQRDVRSGFVGARQGVHFGFDSRVQLRAGSGATRSALASPQPK